MQTLPARSRFGGTGTKGWTSCPHERTLGETRGWVRFFPPDSVFARPPSTSLLFLAWSQEVAESNRRENLKPIPCASTADMARVAVLLAVLSSSVAIPPGTNHVVSPDGRLPFTVHRMLPRTRCV